MASPEMTWYIVIHESTFTRNDRLCDPGVTTTRRDYGVASMLHTTYEGAENALAYCEGLQAEGRPGTDGRYFIATVTA